MLSISDSGERHSEENKLSLEKNMKRRYKTPAQVMALERFYNGIVASPCHILSLLHCAMLIQSCFKRK